MNDHKLDCWSAYLLGMEQGGAGAVEDEDRVDFETWYAQEFE